MLQFVALPVEGAMSVDNQLLPVPAIRNLLAANIQMISYGNGQGAREYNDRPRVKERFTDPSPYESLINAWMTVAAQQALTLAQARVIKNAFIDALYFAKRVLPYSFHGQNWDTSDEAMIDWQLQMGVGQGGALDALAASATAADQALTANVNAMSLWATTVCGSTQAGVCMTWSTNVYKSWVSDPPAVVSGAVGTVVYAVPVDGVSEAGLAITDAQTMMGQIAGRRRSLNLTRAQKKYTINSTSDIASIIAFNATAGWIV